VYGAGSEEGGMPNKIWQLTAGDGKVVAYDDRLGQFFFVTFKPLELETLEKDELVEMVKFVLCGGEPDAVV
jgi:hypothetical protein